MQTSSPVSLGIAGAISLGCGGVKCTWENKKNFVQNDPKPDNMNLSKLSGIQLWKETKKSGYNLQNETNPVYGDRPPSSQARSHFFLEIWGSSFKRMGNIPNWKRI